MHSGVWIRTFLQKRSWSVSLENSCVFRVTFNRIRCYTRMRTNMVPIEKAARLSFIVGPQS
jgi:hypothetical protein